MRPQALELAVKQQRTATHPFDLFDMALGLLGVVSGQPIVLGSAVALYFARRSVAVAAALLRAMDAPPALADHAVTRALLPGAVRLLSPSDQDALPNDDTPVPDADPFALAAPNADAVSRGAGQRPTDHQHHLLDDLARLPRRVTLTQITPWPASTTALPLGVDASGALHWLDLADDTLHIGLYGVTGAGKDSLLRLWFLGLARRNPPNAVQFAVLDGKGDWLTPNLARLAHMRFAPAGGYGATGAAAILAGMAVIDREAQRRQQLITSAGYRTHDRFVAETGIAMPLLVVLITDGMDAVQGDVEALLLSLVAKARALGIRVVVSMQVPSGKELGWRANLSTVLAGALTDGSQDAPALGLRDTRQMRYRPSMLPPPAVRPGVFVVRHGGEQRLVQAPYLDETSFDRMVAELPHTARSEPTATPRANPNAHADGALLASLLGTTTAVNHPSVLSSPVAFAEALPTAVVEALPPRRWEIDIHALQPTQEEVQQIGRALEIYRRCNNKQQAIEGVFDCRKGSSAKWQRAVRLFDLANAGANAEREQTLSAP